MRISDWSSDVCSSDLGRIDDRAALAPLGHQTGIGQLGKVEAHRGSGHVKRFGQGASGDTALARLHQQAERGEPMLMRQSGQGTHGVCRFHGRSEEHTSELQSLMRISYAVFCLKKKNTTNLQIY